MCTAQTWQQLVFCGAAMSSILRVAAAPARHAASSLCPLCCLPAPSPAAAVSHLSPASACSTTKLVWLRSSEIPSRDRDVSLIAAAGVTGKQNGGEGEHRRCGRRVNIESEGMEKNPTAEEREGAVRDGERAEEQQWWEEIGA